MKAVKNVAWRNHKYMAFTFSYMFFLRVIVFILTVDKRILSARYCLLAIFLLLFSIHSIQAKTVVIGGAPEFKTVHDRTKSAPNQPPPNVPPIANAGPDQTITAPASSVILNGSASSDPDGTIVSYSWVLTTGQGSVIISNSNQVIAGVSGLTPGSYTFQLTVTDNSGATTSDSITVTVNPAIITNQPPVAIAGSDTTIYLPASSFQLNASNSYDPDGNITSYQWQEISGPNTAAASSMNGPEVDLSGLEEGIYQFQLTVTDNQGASSTATVLISVDKNSQATDQFIVFPNPAQNILTGRINSSLNGTIRMVVYDMIGRLVIADEEQKSVNLYEKSLNVSGLATGMYSIQVNIANMKFMVAKFFKK